MKKFLVAIAFGLIAFVSNAQVDSAQLFLDSLEARFQYQQGEIQLADSIGTLNVPETFRFLDAQQSRFVLEQLWGNPEDETVMGMIVPANKPITSDDAWAFIVTYEEMGYVEDDDADDIDYDDLLEEMKTDAAAANEARVQGGYEPIEIVGWASEPFYDQDNKVLHWAKEIKFGETDVNTLNYNVRILGRKGVLVMNAVSSIGDLPEVQKSITPVLSSFTYADGLKYSDFDPDYDEVAAWTIGGLVAGKVLAKTGLIALLLKNIKLIIIGLGAFATGIWRWYKKKTSLPDVKNFGDSQNT
jgi:uncharacterized membrane-anchored protein